MKVKQKGAQKGHALLKRKADALTAKFRGVLARIRAAKHEMGALMRHAALAMAQVNYAAGDISMPVREAVQGAASLQVRARTENVAGVQLPALEAFLAPAPPVLDLTAISRGGQQVQKCRETHQRVLHALLHLATLQTAFHILDDVIRTTNRRVNALEHLLLPKTDNTIAYIASELDEQDREEFFRLKKIQAKKKHSTTTSPNADTDYEDDDHAQMLLQDTPRTTSILDQEYDPDLIF